MAIQHRIIDRVSGLLACAFAAVLASGCQVPGGATPKDSGYYTWVDEQGRVHSTPIQSEPAESPAPSRDSGAPAEQRPPADEYTLDNYPDGNELEKQGFIRPGDRQPYFTWRDAEGNVRVSYYRPDTRSDVDRGRISPPLELTPAEVYQPGQPGDLPEADPDALAVLGIDTENQTFFEQWQSSCCEALILQNAIEWQRGREFRVPLDSTASEYRFASGPSRYRLVKLPAGEDTPDFVLRMRSFNTEGMFIPSLAFLDERLSPLRIVTDFVAPYTPETWYRHGYIEVLVPVFPAAGEKWLLIFSRAEDAGGQTVFESKKGPVAIPHRATGELGLGAAP